MGVYIVRVGVYIVCVCVGVYIMCVWVCTSSVCRPVPGLVMLLQDPDAAVRMKAAEAMGRFH